MKKQLLAALFTLAVTPWALADMRIGVSIAQVDDVFLAQMRDYMAAHAKELPGVTLQFEDAQGDVVRQLNQVQNFTAQGMDAIIVNAVDTAATAKMTVNAQQAKIPLVYVNRRPSSRRYRRAWDMWARMRSRLVKSRCATWPSKWAARATWRSCWGCSPTTRPITAPKV